MTHRETTKRWSARQVRALLLWRVALRFPLPQLSDERQSPLSDQGLERSSGARAFTRRCRREGNKVKVLSFGASSRPPTLTLLP